MKVDVEYIVKIKGKKVPIFKKGWEKGEIARVIMTFTIPKKDLDSPVFKMAIHNTADEIINDYVVVEPKIVKTKTPINGKRKRSN